MARKRGEYQKRKERQDRFKTGLAILSILLITFALVWLIANEGIAIRHIRQNALEKYTGSYSYELKRTYGKHTHYYYLFNLDNGDVLSIPKSKIENEEILEERYPLTFQYTKGFRKNMFSPVYVALSIETADGQLTIVTLESSYNGCVRSIWIMAIFLFVWLLLFGGLFIMYFYVVHKDKRILKRAKER